jgi:hypothetical protein
VSPPYPTIHLSIYPKRLLLPGFRLDYPVCLRHISASDRRDTSYR